MMSLLRFLGLGRRSVAGEVSRGPDEPVVEPPPPRSPSMSHTPPASKTEFEGILKTTDGRELCRPVRGEYEPLPAWPDRFRGTFDVDPSRLPAGGVERLRDSFAREFLLEVPGPGNLPIVLGEVQPSGSAPPTRFRFESIGDPFPFTKREVHEALTIPIADLLEEAGHPGLAEIARAAAVRFELDGDNGNFGDHWAWEVEPVGASNPGGGHGLDEEDDDRGGALN